MKKTISFIIALQMFTMVCKAQERIIWTPDVKIDLNGFRISNENEDTTSHASFTLVKKKEKIKKGNIIYHYTEVNAALQPQQSWIKAENANNEEIQKISSQFNLLQQTARELRNELLFTDDRTTPEKERKLMKEYNSLRDSLEKSGKLSGYTIEEDTFDVSGIDYTEKTNGQGISIGLYSDFALNDMSRLCPAIAGINIAFSHERVKDYMSIQASVGIGKGNPEITNLGSTVPNTAIHFNYGRYFSTRTIKIAWYAGAGYNGRTVNSNILAGGPSIHEGIHTDIALNTNIFLNRPQATKTESKMRIGIYLDQTLNISRGGIIPSAGVYVNMMFNNKKISKK